MPRSLFWRLVWLLSGGLILAQACGAWLLLNDRDESLYRLLALNSAQSLAATVRLLDTQPPEQRPELVRRISLPSTKISLDTPWLADQDDSLYVRHLSGLLRRLLDEQLEIHIHLSDPMLLPPPHMGHMNAPPQPDTDRPPPRSWRLRQLPTLLVQVRLHDGQVVSFQHATPDEVFSWPYRVLIIIGILLLSVLLLVSVAVRWLTRPLATLALAASELGRDIRRPPLLERGPLEVRRAARAFNTMQTRLQRYIQDRSRILAAVSHDLKTPITRLRLRAELLEDELLRDKILHDLDDMQLMVQATLDFMRGTEDPERVAAIDLQALLESLQEDAAERGQTITLHGHITQPFLGRPLALKRCLSNLLDNAAHYADNTAVEVYLQDATTQVSISIEDRGPGIPEAELERVFEPFYRLEQSRNRHTGGTGLGLSIARNTARAHGGELSLVNRTGGGLQVLLVLPR